MIRNIFIITLRRLLKNRLYTIINLLGFCLTLSSVMVIVLFIRFEMSYDTHYPENRKIYRINTTWSGTD